MPVINPPNRTPENAGGYQRYGVIENFLSNRDLPPHAELDGVEFQPNACDQPISEWIFDCDNPAPKSDYIRAVRPVVGPILPERFEVGAVTSTITCVDAAESAKTWLNDAIELRIESTLGAQLIAAATPLPAQDSILCAASNAAGAIAAIAGPVRGVIILSVAAALNLLSTHYLTVVNGKLVDALGNQYVVFRTIPEPNTLYSISDAQIELWLSEAVLLETPFDVTRDRNDLLSRYEQSFILINSSCAVSSVEYTECSI